MRCDKVRSLLLPYIEGELPQSAASKVAEHLQRCSACKSDYIRLLEVKKIISEHKDWREISPSPELSDSVLRRLRVERSRIGVRTYTRRRNYLLYLATVVALLLLVTIVGITLFEGREERKPKDEYVARKEKPRKEPTSPERKRDEELEEKLEEVKRSEEHREVKRPSEEVEKPCEERFAEAEEPRVPEEVKTPEPAERFKPIEKAEKPRPPTETPKTAVKPPVIIAVVDMVLKKPQVKRKGKERWEVLKKGDSLFSGDELRTDSGEKTSLVLSDNSVLILNSASEVSVERRDRLWIIRLEKGEIFAQVVPQKEKSGFQVLTPSATITVKGTELNIKHRYGKTTLTVIKGEVECSNDKGSVRVNGGYQVRVRVNGKPSKPKRVSSERLMGLTRWTDVVLPIPEPVAGAKPPVGFGYYEGCGKATWGRTNVTSHSGRYSAFLKGTKYEENYLNIALVIGDSDGYRGANAFTCSPNTEYSFSFWVKGNFKNVKVAVTQWKTDEAPLEDRVSQRITTFVPTPRWTRIEGRFTTHQQAKKFVLILKASGKPEEMNLGVIYVDDVVIKKKGTEKNIVENPGLENSR